MGGPANYDGSTGSENSKGTEKNGSLKPKNPTPKKNQGPSHYDGNRLPTTGGARTGGSPGRSRPANRATKHGGNRRKMTGRGPSNLGPSGKPKEVIYLDGSECLGSPCGASRGTSRRTTIPPVERAIHDTRACHVCDLMFKIRCHAPTTTTTTTTCSSDVDVRIQNEFSDGNLNPYPSIHIEPIRDRAWPENELDGTQEPRRESKSIEEFQARRSGCLGGWRVWCGRNE